MDDNRPREENQRIILIQFLKRTENFMLFLKMDKVMKIKLKLIMMCLACLMIMNCMTFLS